MEFTAQLHILVGLRWPTRAVTKRSPASVRIPPTANDAAGQADVPRTL